MRKTLVIAAREYSAAVRSKAFVISLILLPVMMGGGFIAQRATQKIGDSSTKRIGMIDRTPGAVLFEPVVTAAEKRNANEIFDLETHKQMKARFEFEKVEPAPSGDVDAVKRQRFELSERVRKGDLFAFVELGEHLLDPKISTPTTKDVQASEHMDEMNAEQKLAAGEALIGEPNLIRYTSNRPTYTDLKSFLQRMLPQQVYLRRMSAAELPAAKVMPLLTPPLIADRGLVTRDATGKLTQDTEAGTITAFIVPLVLLFLMFIIVLVGTSPMTTNVIEEKQMRIAEVLLGSVRPFELMMGKLLGGVGVALTLAVIYVGGGYWLAMKQGVASYVSTPVLMWFLLFTVLATMMYGSLFVAVGAAATNVKEAQSLITPVMMLILLPMFVFGPLLQDPSGPLPTIVSFFPFSAPMMATARIAIPPGIPMWQALTSVVISLLTTVGVIWCAGRVFRVGILMQGQGARLGEILRWVWRG